MGFEVLAVDTSEALLEELGVRAGERRVHPVLGDIRDPGVYAEVGPFDVVVCMGDTLPHLRSYEEVETLFGDVRGVLGMGGTLALEFRDYGVELTGAERAIPVRMGDDRIMATFLEYGAEHVNVHDMVFERESEGWTMRKSAYTKLRLGVRPVLHLLERVGARVVRREEESGFFRIVAEA